MQRNLVIQNLNRITAERVCRTSLIECCPKNNRFGWTMTPLFYDGKRCGLISPASTNQPVTISLNIDLIPANTLAVFLELTLPQEEIDG